MHEFITSLPLGYGTPVGERGVRLSGGQKQRIALARVLLTDPRILILDEPTSSVDVATERLMQQALDVARAGRTTFVIAHRLWTIRHADQILVLRDGHIVEQARGSATQSAHEALLARDGLYQELYALQVAGETLMPDAEAPEDPGPQPFAAPPTGRARRTTAKVSWRSRRVHDTAGSDGEGAAVRLSSVDRRALAMLWHYMMAYETPAPPGGSCDAGSRRHQPGYAYRW